MMKHFGNIVGSGLTRFAKGSKDLARKVEDYATETVSSLWEITDAVGSHANESWNPISDIPLRGKQTLEEAQRELSPFKKEIQLRPSERFKSEYNKFLGVYEQTGSKRATICEFQAGKFVRRKTTKFKNTRTGAVLI